MKLWLIDQTDRKAIDYDTHDAEVIAAETAEEACAATVTIGPRATWQVTCIADDTPCERGSVIASFNAG